jgi:hypothetical protein
MSIHFYVLHSFPLHDVFKKLNVDGYTLLTNCDCWHVLQNIFKYISVSFQFKFIRLQYFAEQMSPKYLFQFSPAVYTTEVHYNYHISRLQNMNGLQMSAGIQASIIISNVLGFTVVGRRR